MRLVVKADVPQVQPLVEREGKSILQPADGALTMVLYEKLLSSGNVQG